MHASLKDAPQSQSSHSKQIDVEKWTETIIICNNKNIMKVAMAQATLYSMQSLSKFLTINKFYI